MLSKAYLEGRYGAIPVSVSYTHLMSELHILRFHRIFRLKCMKERENLYRQTKVAINVADISILVKDRILDSFGQN